MKLEQVYGYETQTNYLLKARESYNSHRWKKYFKNKLQARAVSINSLGLDTIFAVTSVPMVSVYVGIKTFQFWKHFFRLEIYGAERKYMKLTMSLGIPAVTFCQLVPQTIGLFSPELETNVNHKISHKEWTFNYIELLDR